MVFTRGNEEFPWPMVSLPGRVRFRSSRQFVDVHLKLKQTTQQNASLQIYTYEIWHKIAYTHRTHGTGISTYKWFDFLIANDI